MRVVIAPQEFKGTLTATQAARAMAAAVRRRLPGAERIQRAMADGGPGTLATLLASLGGQLHRRRVSGPTGEPVPAEWASLSNGAAVVEMAQAAGLRRMKGPPQPLTAATYGVGELLRAALDAGHGRILVGLGGSATTDGGAGMAAALGLRLLDASGRPLPPGGGSLVQLAGIDARGLDPRLGDAEIVALYDVDNPLTGERGAPRVFGPQKGATPDDVVRLEEGFRRLEEIVRRELGRDCGSLPGAGAAGGLGFGLAAFCGARLARGAREVARVIGLEDLLREADLCLTGEGQFDFQTAGGKAVMEVISLSGAARVPVVVVAGRLGPGWEALGRSCDLVMAVEGSPIASACGAGLGLRLATEDALSRWLMGNGDVDAAAGRARIGTTTE